MQSLLGGHTPLLTTDEVGIITPYHKQVLLQLRVVQAHAHAFFENLIGGENSSVAGKDGIG